MRTITFKLARHFDPAWHRNLRKRRQRLRARLAGRSGLLGTGTKRRLRFAVSGLHSHHSYNFRELPPQVQRLCVMTWHCFTCKVNNTPKMTHCRVCQAHWSAVWAAPRRSRSKSARKKGQSTQDYKATEKVSQEADSWAVFPDKLPWISSTPASRANNRKAEIEVSMEKPLGLPPAPILPPAPSVEEPMGLTAEEEKLLQHLRGIQAMEMDLTESMASKLEELAMREAKVQSSKTLTHGHLNKLNKLKSQMAAAAKKIKDLDGEWMAFVNTTLTKIRQHGEMFQNCRADLMEQYNAKIQELAAVKQEMKMASQSLLGPQWTEPFIPEAPDLEQQLATLQETMCGRPHWADRFDRGDGRGGVVRGGSAEQGHVWKEHSEGNAPFSWIQFANKSGKPSPQSQSARCKGSQKQREGQGGQVACEVAHQDRDGSCKFGASCVISDLCVAFRQEVEQFWQSHFNQPFSWIAGLCAMDANILWNEDGSSIIMNESTRNVPDQHLEIGCDIGSEDDSDYTWVTYQRQQEVESKFEPLIFSVGSLDSLQSFVRADLSPECDVKEIGMSDVESARRYERPPLRDGTEDNLDLCTSQAKHKSKNFSQRYRSEAFEGVPDAEQFEYTWCSHAATISQAVLQFACKKRVGFCDSVEVRFVHDLQTLDVVIAESMRFDMLRHFWHLHGQITTWGDLQRVVTKLAGQGLVEVPTGNTEGGDQLVVEVDRQHVEIRNLEEAHPDGLWWQGLTSMCAREDPRPEFIATWYLAPHRFHVCLRPRRIKFHRLMRFGEFQEACRAAWLEVMNGQPLTFLLVDGKPEGLPSTRAHVIIIQGGQDCWNAVLMKGTGLPPLMSIRAVLFDKENTVTEFFQIAQYPEACTARHFLCCVEFEHEREMHRVVDHEICVLPTAKFVVGSLCTMDDTDDEVETISTAATDLPVDEEEDVFSSMVTASEVGREQTWTWEQDQMTPIQDPAFRPWSWMHQKDEWKGSDGSEGNLDLTWSAFSNDSDEMENDGISWMSNRPIALQFERPDPYPWDMEAADVLDEEEEEFDAEVGFADGQQELAQTFIDQALEGVEEDGQRWVAITFGLGLVDLGRRDVEFNPWRLPELVDKIRNLWEDHLRYGGITLYHVNPQPCEVAGPRSLVVLVVIESPDDMNEDVRNVLVIQRGPREIPLRPAPYGAKIFTDLSQRDALVQLDMHKHCKPFRMRDCLVRLGFQVMEEDHRYDVEHGMLCTVRVEQIPTVVIQANAQIERIEDFYLQVEEVQRMEGAVHQVICHVHGITLENRPLGWRQLILEGNDLLHLDWIAQLRQLWPFESRDARISFCTMATDDFREAEKIHFHFVIDYGAREGVPILVRQQIVAAQTMPQRSEGASEYWAITVMEGAVSTELFSALSISPFWFASAMRQNVRPHITHNGRRMEGLQAMWQTGDFAHIRLQVWQVHHMLNIMLNDGDEIAEDDVVEHTSFLQVRHAKKRQLGSFSETCEALCRHEEGETCMNEVDNERKQTGIQSVANEVNLDDRRSFMENDLIADIQGLLRHVMSRDGEGICADFTVIPHLHPHAQIAWRCSEQDSGDGQTFHVFTDGSCKHEHATWAITILRQYVDQGRSFFHRVGYAGGHVTDDLGRFDNTAMDAEATAIIAMIEYALGQCDRPGISIFCHFDAMAVGFGAMGTCNIPMQQGSQSDRQRGARILMTILESKVRRMQGSTKGVHVKAHQGHPWNEMSDSIAKAIWWGWKPPEAFVFRAGSLLRHSLAEWAWIEVAPTRELPGLRTILDNEKPKSDKGCIDSTLTLRGKAIAELDQRATLIFATVNVGTLEYGSGDGQGVSWKVVELLHQIEAKGIHIVGVQESRARKTRCLEMGPFTRIIVAGEQGQAGVELWLNGRALGHMLGVDYSTDKDICTWHADKRALAVRCSIGSLAFDVMVLYAPQRGRGQVEIAEWWDHINSIMQKRDANIPVFCLGDFNASLGSVCCEECGDHAWDVEDDSGEKLREFAMKWDLLIPSTFGQYHEGSSATFVSPLGHESRIDFILVSKGSQSGIRRTYVDSGMDILNGDRDHRPVIMEIDLKWQPKSDPRFVRLQFYDREAARTWSKGGGEQLLESLHEQPWSSDVNAHWAQIRQHLQSGAAKYFPRQKRKPRQLYFSRHTWQLLCDRKDLRQQHREVNRAIQKHMMRKIFHAWKRPDEVSSSLADWDLALLRQQAAVVLEARCNIDVRFRARKKKDWKEWVQDQLNMKLNNANHAPNDALFKILQPKKMIAKHAGKLTKPLPGYKGLDGEWKFARYDIAAAWQQQFADIENAHCVEFSELLAKSEPECVQIHVEQLNEIPTLLDVEKALRKLDAAKAPGLDGLGAELFQGNLSMTARRIFPLVLKMGLRCQGVPELTGGWLLPLFKGKGSAFAMKGYRAILLEPVLARAISRAWRPNLVRGLSNIAQPMQWGGRAGLSIESLHLQVQMWQAQARKERMAHALIFIDIKAAFYSVVKEMLTGGRKEQDIRKVFHRMRLPASAWECFRSNVEQKNTLWHATGSHILADSTKALLQHTWFIVPDGQNIQAPLTGSRPGDPGADVLFSLILSRIMEQVHVKATEAGMPMYLRDERTGQPIAMCVTWVDDLAVSVCATAEQIVGKAIHMLSIIQDIMLEHGMILTTGVGKTAAIFAFHGEGATQARQALESNFKDGLRVMSEHMGCVKIPVVTHYKHLGGHITRIGSCFQEIKVRGANALAKLKPLNKLLKDNNLAMEKKRLLVKSLGISVLTLHAGTWTDMTQREYEAWQASVFKVY